MTTKQMIFLVDQFLDSRDLKDPNIRKRAIRKVIHFIDSTGSFLSGQNLALPPDKHRIAAAYEKYKGSPLNSAEKSVINHMYLLSGAGFVESVPTSTTYLSPIVQETSGTKLEGFSEIEETLINGEFKSVRALSSGSIPDSPGLYCIKLQEGSMLPSRFGKIREDGILYIGKADVLRKRLWEEELNHKRPATFFRGIGAALGYLPPKGSLIGKSNQKNYKFSPEDTDAIRRWMGQALLVNWMPIDPLLILPVEKTLINNYQPLMNTMHNPNPSKELAAARKRCRDYALNK